MDSVVLVLEKGDWLPAFLDTMMERGARVLQGNRAQPWNGWAVQARRFSEVEAVVVDTDTRYRDRVLRPSLLAIGFTRVHTAKNADRAARLIDQNPRIGVVVMGDDLQTPDEKRAVARAAGANLIPLVLLTSSAEPMDPLDCLADQVLSKKSTSILETVQQIKRVAMRAWLRTASVGQPAVVPSC